MDLDEPTPLLGGLSPQKFMRRHWQKKPLLIRQALTDAPVVDRAQLFALAGQEDVESRLIRHDGKQWSLRRGPIARRSFPKLAQPGWTLLVQGLDAHLEAAHELLSRFRFVPDARLDDLMVSWASDSGGVGPHVDSYDVFLLQLQGRRRWRIAAPAREAAFAPAFVPDLPLKILANFEPEQEWLLEPGDMLYLPPGWAHEGSAVGECLTASIGFRAPGRADLRSELLQRMLDASDDEDEDDAIYVDPTQPASDEPARIPAALRSFAGREIMRWVTEPRALDCALGELLSEPKPQVWFPGGVALKRGQGVRLDRRTRMLYDDHHVFINGESFRAAGRDARAMRQLADERRLDASAIAKLSDDARELLSQWVLAGWAHAPTTSTEP